MDLSWIIFTVCVLMFAWRGYRQGVLGALSRIVGLAVGYGLALLYGASVGGLLQTHTGLKGMGAYILGSLLVFFFASTLIGIIFSFAQRLLDRGKKRSMPANVLGITTGAGIGVVFGLVAVFAVGYFRDLYTVTQSRTTSELTERSISGIEQFSKSIAGKLITFATKNADADPATVKITAALATNPGVVVSGLQQVVNNPAAKSLFNDPQNQRVLNSQDTQAIAALPEFQRLATNPDIQRLAAVSGMDTTDQAAFEQQLAGQFGTMWTKAQQIKNDPEIQAILNDPQFREQLQSKNPMALLNDPRFMTIFSRLIDSSSEPKGSQSLSQAKVTPDASVNEAGKDETKVYHWVDESGRTHYSDKPRPQ